ncbi:MAG: U32 family peptidase [Alphaproteobacteria bacterium]|jgi:putative protease|nr:U32 family peptidase [Alphaproteobacteria bacterium]
MKKAELLSPGGSLRKIKTALLYGADAVYLGTPDLSLRTKSEITMEDLLEVSRICRANNKKFYLTLNLFSHNKDIAKLPQFVETIKQVQPDGILIADPGVFDYVKERLPNINLHISTQANVCSSLSVNFWKKQGAALCVMAREVSFNELKEIKEQCDGIKIEAFIHGSMCMTYSGRCLLSNFMAERGANQGSCANSCRWNYKLKVKLKDDSLFDLEINESNKDLLQFYLEEEFREGEFFEIQEDEMGAYILNSKDLCLMPVLADYLEAGIDTLKIEGRNKSEYYAAITARSYRLAIDSYYKDPQNFNYKTYLNELYTIQNRGYTMAFHDGRLTNLSHNYDLTKTISDYAYAGIIIGYETDYNGEECILMEVRNLLKSGDILEFISPFLLEPIRIRLYEFIDANNGYPREKISPGKANQAIRIPLSLFHNEEKSKLKEMLPEFTVVRKVYIEPMYETFFKHNKVSFGVEQGTASQSVLDKLQEKVDILKKEKWDKEANKDKTLLKPCCSKGCNGCMIFWQGDEYAKLRDKMKDKKIGEKLIKNIDF